MGTPFTDLYPEVMPELPGCPAVIILPTIINVAREFCFETQAWKHDLDLINVLADVAEYDLDTPPKCAEIIVPTYVALSDVEQQPGTDYTMPSRCVLQFVTAPGADEIGALKVQVALRPKLATDETCEDVFNDYHEIWAWGTMARLMAMLKKGWSNPAQATRYHAMYWNGINTARVELNRGKTNRELSARPAHDWLGD